MTTLLSFFSSIMALIMLVSPFSQISDFKTVSNDISEEIIEENTMTLKVATFNIQNGAGVDHDFSVIAQDILDNDIDIIGLQEVDRRTGRNGKQDTMKILSELTGYEYYQYTTCIFFDGGRYGTGVLSKYPIEEYESINLDSDVHEQRMLGHAVINVNGTLIDFYNTHLSWESTETRAKQFSKISQLTSDDNMFIITGDFNTPDFNEYSVINNCILSNSSENTMISNGEDGAIDNIVISDNFKLIKTKLIDEIRHSDHYMITSEISFVPQIEPAE